MSNKLMRKCYWMGSQFNDWTDYNGLASAIKSHRVRRMGFAQNCGGKKYRQVEIKMWTFLLCVSNHDQRIYRVHVL